MKSIKVAPGVGLAVYGSLAAVGLAFAVFMAYLTIHGFVLAYKASVLLFVIALFVEPTPLLIGAFDFFGGINLAQQVTTALGLH